MKITVITPTGGRPECFAIYEAMLKCQTVQPTYCIIIDDYDPPTKCTLGQTYIRGPRAWEPGLNTHRSNMEEGLKHIPKDTDVCLFLEDDDAYAPTYIENMVNLLKHSVIAGLGESRYYHVGIPGFITMPNFAHASLSQTAIRASLLPTMVEAVNSGDMYFDIVLWRKCRERKLPWTLLHNTKLSVGVKGMPGKLGLTPSHDKSTKYFHDGNYEKLKEWLGDDIKYYLPYLKPLKQKFKPAIKQAK